MRVTLIFAGLLLFFAVVAITVADAWSWAAVLFVVVAVGGFVVRGLVSRGFEKHRGIDQP